MSNDISLYALSSRVEELLNSEQAFDPETGELSAELQEALGDARSKGQDVVAFILNRDAQVAAMDAHIAAVNARKSKLVERNAKLREYLAEQMKRLKIAEIAAKDGTFCAKLFIERDASVDVFDEKQVPFTYFVAPKVPEPKISKSEISKAIKAGKEVPGSRIVKKDRLVIE